jgi:hypothetical protein
MGYDVFQLTLELADPPAGQSTVSLQLGFARASGADAAAESFQVGPLTGESRQQVLGLCQLYLQHTLFGPRPVGKDVQD